MNSGPAFVLKTNQQINKPVHRSFSEGGSTKLRALSENLNELSGKKYRKRNTRNPQQQNTNP